jgi:transcriptional regulator with XRE-family HTH domain
MGITEQLFGKYVNGHVHPSLERLHQIAEALDLRVKDLFFPVS